ncbi:MAG: hypothetical protein QM775_04370 [Pirellulales bacterium]
MLLFLGFQAAWPHAAQAQSNDGYAADNEGQSRKRTRAGAKGFEAAASSSSSSSSFSNARRTGRSDQVRLAVEQSKLPGSGYRLGDKRSAGDRDQDSEVDHEELVDSRAGRKKMKADAKALLPQSQFMRGRGSEREELRGPQPKSTEDPERQVLSEIATQLFEAAVNKSKTSGRRNPVEIQLMKDKSGKIWIAANDQDTVNSVRELLEHPDRTELEKALTTMYKIGGERSIRYAEKLDDLIKGRNCAEQLPEAKEIVDTLLNKRESVQVLDAKVKGKARTDRHAEEYLVDEIVNQNDRENEYVIAGKKRPCLSCSGRMAHAAETLDFNLRFGQQPGRLFIQAWEGQPFEVAMKTLELVKRRRTAVTFERGRPQTSYDDASDSEAEPNIDRRLESDKLDPKGPSSRNKRPRTSNESVRREK